MNDEQVEGFVRRRKMQKQLISCTGWSSGQTVQIEEGAGKVEMLVAGPRGGIIAFVQFNRDAFCDLVQDLAADLLDRQAASPIERDWAAPDEDEAWDKL